MNTNRITSIVFVPILKMVLTGVLFFVIVGCVSEKKGQNESEVYIEETEEGYRMIRNNEPYFIKGASGNAYFEELKKAGANTIRIYDTLNLKSYLDSAETWGLAAVVDIPIPRYSPDDTLYGNPAKMDALVKNTEKFVEKYKHHPAVLYWILGNEVYVHDMFFNDFVEGFNRMIEKVHEIDPDHPISTTVSSSGLKKVFSILVKSPDLDFISVNSFGALNDFRLDKDILFFWQKPYVLSEWGNNGPWETETTAWTAPIEETSTKKAEQYKNLYIDNIQSIADNRCLGSLAFYWGHKQERTHTWFSLFDEDGNKSQTVFVLESLWKGTELEYRGPEIDYVLLNGKGAAESILVNQNEIATAELFVPKQDSLKKFSVTWEIRPENWYYNPHDNEKKPEIVKGLILQATKTDLRFKTPDQEGPYRLFVKVESPDGPFATANTPFYVLTPRDVP
ncbi:MAG: glycoside hydrolase family 2 TIM barrel-domain containing protein [Pricia sp.]